MSLISNAPKGRHKDRRFVDDPLRQVSLDLPKSVRDRLNNAAKERGTSMNRLVEYILEAALAEYEAEQREAKK